MRPPSRRSIALLGSILVAALWPARLARAAGGEGDLSRAIGLFENLDDEGASAVLTGLLAQQPASHIAAKAHIYLGLIALNALHTDEARAQLKQALETDPTIELPPRASPKAKTVFGQVRQQVASEAQTRAAAPLVLAQALTPPTTPPPMVQAVEPAPSAEASESGGSSHWPSFALGGAAAVAVAVAIIGGAEDASYNSWIGTLKSNPSSVDAQQVLAKRGPAQAWNVTWVVATGVAVACAGGAVLTW